MNGMNRLDIKQLRVLQALLDLKKLVASRTQNGADPTSHQ
ncbi:transcriptional regulator, LysR family [Psychrobacter sp. JCM 18901]|nr:transcriptional regulator, LysR family [Psychrobacter sp. JCM 18901]